MYGNEPSTAPKAGHSCILRDLQHRGKNQKWLPHPYLLGGPKEGGSAMSPLRSRGSTTQGEGNKSGPRRAPGKNPIVGVLNGGP